MLAIPEEHKPLIVALAQLSDNDVESIVKELANPEHSISRRREARRISQALGVSPVLAMGFISLLGSLSISRASLNIETSDEMAQDVVRAVIGARLEGFEEGSALATRLESHLRRLLSSESALEPLAKAEDLLYTYPRLLQSARVLTDVRPVFSSSGTPKAVASVVAHTLVMDTNEGGTVKQQQMFVSMDIRDLRKLREVIDRAIAKDESIRDTLKDTQLAAIRLD